MAGRLILLSHTPIDSPGGVPRWCRDIRDAFPDKVVKHYSWWDVPASADDHVFIEEWDKAKIMNTFLVWSGAISREDVILGDGFWCHGLDAFPKVVSVAHGIWSHLTDEDVRAGKKPEFPMHHLFQVAHRQRHIDNRKPIVAVSRFIQKQMFLQWGFPSYVINNGVDCEEYKPVGAAAFDMRAISGLHEQPLIIHGVNDRGNGNKGWSFIERIIKRFPQAVVRSFDEACSAFHWTRQEALAVADLVVIPSGYEGNSYFALEAMACGAPVVAYNVGLFHEILERGLGDRVGKVLARHWRDEDLFCDAVESMLSEDYGRISDPRSVAKDYSIENFRAGWRHFLDERFDFLGGTEC